VKGCPAFSLTCNSVPLKTRRIKKRAQSVTKHGNVKVSLEIMFYEENLLISKIPPKIPPNPPLQRGEFPFSKGGTSKPPLRKGEDLLFLLNCRLQVPPFLKGG